MLRHGDLSVVSFHATKVFNTFEGGLLVSSDSALKRKIDHLKNFGFVDETTVIEAGLNGKMSEFNAALGLVQLRHLDRVRSARGNLDALYRKLLTPVRGISCIEPRQQVERNYAYFPILVEQDFNQSRDELYEHLKYEDIYARRYFYPLISAFPMYRDLPSSDPSNLPVATDISQRIICSLTRFI